MKTAVKIDPEKIARLKKMIKNEKYMAKALDALASKLSEDF